MTVADLIAALTEIPGHYKVLIPGEFEFYTHPVTDLTPSPNTDEVLLS